MMSLTLDLLPGELVIMRLPPGSPIRTEPFEGAGLTALITTPEETTLVCPVRAVPGSLVEIARVQAGWRGLRVQGPLDFSLVGVLASLAGPLAEAGISIFALSTFDTDYVLVQAAHLEQALAALERAGHVIERKDPL